MYYIYVSYPRELNVSNTTITDSGLRYLIPTPEVGILLYIHSTYSIQYTKERDIQSWAHASTVATIRHCFMANRLSPVALPLNAYLYSMFSPRTEHVSYFSLSQNTRSFITLSHCRLSYCYRIVSSPALCICIVSGAVSVICAVQPTELNCPSVLFTLICLL